MRTQSFGQKVKKLVREANNILVRAQYIGKESTRKEVTGSKILGRSQMGPNLFFIGHSFFIVVVVNLKHLPIAL